MLSGGIADESFHPRMKRTTAAYTLIVLSWPVADHNSCFHGYSIYFLHIRNSGQYGQI